MESLRCSFYMMLCLIGATYIQESVAWRHKIADNATIAGLKKIAALTTVINGAGAARQEEWQRGKQVKGMKTTGDAEQTARIAAPAPWQEEWANKKARRGSPSTVLHAESSDTATELAPWQKEAKSLLTTRAHRPTAGASSDTAAQLAPWQKEATGLLSPAQIEEDSSVEDAWKAVTPEALDVMFDEIVRGVHDVELPTVSEGATTAIAVQASHWQLYFVELDGFSDEELSRYVMPLWMSIQSRIDPDHSTQNLLTKKDLQAWWAAGGYEDLQQEPKFLQMFHAKLSQPTALVEVVAKKIGDSFDGVDDSKQLSFSELFHKARETGLANDHVIQALRKAWEVPGPSGEASGHDQGYITGSTVQAFKDAFRAAFAELTAPSSP